MPTEVLAFVSFIFLTGLVVGAAFFGRGPLGTLSVAYVLLANLTILVEAPMYGGTIAWAIIIYSATHLILNVVAEKHGIGAAVRIAIMNLCAQCLLWVYLWLFIPQNQIVNDETASIYGSLVTLFQSSTIVTIAALVGSVGWFANIFVYAFLKKLAENKGGIHIAARNIVSVAVGQVLNTVIFFAILQSAVGGDYSSVVTITIAVKFACALIDTPMLYFALAVFPREDGVEGAGVTANLSPKPSEDSAAAVASPS